MINEQLIISVRGPRITGRLSLITLSNPGDLLDGIVRMMRLTSLQLTGWKLNVLVVESARLLIDDNGDGSGCIVALIVEAIVEAESVVFLPTEVKNWLNSSTNTFVTVEFNQVSELMMTSNF